MTKQINYVSKEGFEKLQKELNEMKFVQRPFISKQIADARDKGDLSENAEYHAAKEDQGLLETKIAQLEDLITRTRVIDETKLDTSKVMMLSKVKLLNHATKKEVIYTMVSDSEADFKAGKISIKSPIGSGLMGLKVGDVAEIKVPAGMIKFEVLEISL
ncbi:MAG: transcription elongation factor GreA [Bacteroidia bacterium]|nr:transcription elongation factor GreA [Bacteroidia bacterium]MCZ2140554.1 transcription elongation factor GreA [Bacteroidia bacterium]